RRKDAQSHHRLGSALLRGALTTHKHVDRPLMRSLGLFPALLLTFAYTSLIASPLSSREGVLDLINTLRTADCNHALSSTQRLHANERLDVIARRVMEGDNIDDALRTAEIH